MQVNMNVNGNNDINTSPFANANATSKNSKSIDARNLNLGVNPVDEKKNSARKQAMKLISDAWGKDEKVTENIKNMEDEKAATSKELAELKSHIVNIENEKEMWRQEYGVDKDSQEYKDYKLLEKYQDNKNGASYDEFSDEEIERLKELQNTPLTDFQKKALTLNGAKDALDVEIQRAENSLIAMTESISLVKIDQLKSQDMLKAQDAADEIMYAANEDAIGMLVEESKDHIDETSEEEKEKAEKVNQLELDNKEKNQSVDHIAEVQKSIAKLMDDNHMINEDIKGIEIDLNF